MKTAVYMYLFLCMALSGYAQQQNFVYRGIVRDSATMLPLHNVRIYYNDTIPVLSNSKGEFQLQGNAKARFHFRKAGYVWHTEDMTGSGEKMVCLLKSSLSVRERFSTSYPEEKTEIIFDGRLVPFAEWADVLSINPAEIKSIEWILGESTNIKNKLVINSIFQWNREDF